MEHLWTPWRMPYLKRMNRDMDDDACVFCQKTTTDDDAVEHVLARSSHVYVTLNLYPYNNGHLLVVPYAHVASMEALPLDALTDMMQITNRALAVLREAYAPHAFNIGANIGAAAGAGIEEHFHLHVVPRWAGDTNYMTVVSATRVIPDWIDHTYEFLHDVWQRVNRPA